MRLDVEDLSWGVGGRTIVDRASLSVGGGELVGVIGPNGSGKSSMLRCIYGANTPTGGTVRLDGADVRSMTRREFASRAAAVAQEMPDRLDFTVREMVSMGRYPHKRMLERENSRDAGLVDGALACVGMRERASRRFSSLSGGEKQRTLIARAIAQEAELLLLDEPTNHLDIFYQLEIMELVRRLGVSCLVVMHDLGLAARYCDRIYVMKNGRTEASGAPRDVLTREMIREVYRVECEITFGGDGAPRLAFTGTCR